jgi:hypothetical protein
MFRGKPYIALSPSKGGGSNVKLGIVASNHSAIRNLFLKIFHNHGRVLDYLLLWIEHKNMLWSLQHDPLSPYTKLGDPSIAKLDFYLPQYDVCMIFKGPYIFMVTTLGMCVKQPL